MIQRLDVDEEKGQKPEDARREFDGKLGVAVWRMPGAPERLVEEKDPGAPWWWTGDEEASQGFLQQVGVTLDGH